MTKVYVPQVPSRFDQDVKAWVPTVDLTSAQRFGEIVVVTQPQAYRMAVSQLVPAMKYKMADFAAADYLIALGDPTIMITAALIAASHTGGRVKLLKWDRRLSDYIELEIFV